MSFLNPVSEPVKRFSSTDASAPQINYNARVAGDVKTVLKACLVTGYGTKASAGWSIVNEVDHVAEFVSPSVDMIDYALGINDSSATNTSVYYRYKGNAKSVSNASIDKSINYINKSHPENGWILLVTELGLYFVEQFYTAAAAALQTRVTYWGRFKSALLTGSGDIAYWCIGYGSPVTQPAKFFNPQDTASKYYYVSGVASVSFAAANLSLMSTSDISYGISTVEMEAALYLTFSGQVVGEHPGILLQNINAFAGAYGVSEKAVEARPVLSLSLGALSSSSSYAAQHSRTILIYLDYWEF